MARYHIILGNGEGCGVGMSHTSEESAHTRAELLDANGHGPCRVWEESTTPPTSEDVEWTAEDYDALNY